MKNYLLFYKSFFNYGGAEALLFKHYNHIIQNGNSCTIVTFKNDLLREDNDIKIIEVGGVFGLISYLFFNKFDKIFASSGHIEIYISCLITFNKFNYLIHQPSTMSFNEYDKYAFNNLKKLKPLIDKNYYRLFKKIKHRIKFYPLIKIHFRFLLSLFALRSAKNTFVLSEFAKKEKKILYNIDSHYFSGGISKIYPLVEKQKTNKTINLISLSRLDKNKRIDKVIKAIKFSKNKNIFLDIFGTGNQYNYLNDLIKNLNLKKQVSLKGYLREEDKTSIFYKYDFSICLDFADFRITSIESINYSCPVILSTDTSIADCNKYDFLFLCNPSIPNIKNLINNIQELNVDWKNRENFLKMFLWNNYFNNLDENSI